MLLIIRASKNVPNAERSSKNTSKLTPATTSASTLTRKASICRKCNAPMKKKMCFIVQINVKNLKKFIF